MMEDLKKEINFDPALLYYSTPNENPDETTKTSGLNLVQETYNSINRKHICLICGKRFFTLNSLKTHMEHHPPDKPINANLEKDENTDWKNRFVINKGISCVKTNCNFIALDAVEYCKHTTCCEGIRFTKENCSSYCELCDCYYSSENYFKAHCILQHPENGPNISLEDDDQKNTKISDPVSLYVSEKNSEKERNAITSASPSMYPDSVVTKKKLKCFDVETLSINISEGTSTGVKNENDLNSPVQPSISEAVEILKTAMTANIQTTDKKSTEIYSENEIEPLTIQKADIENSVYCKEISTEIRTSKNLQEEQVTVENNSLEIHSQTSLVSHNSADAPKGNVEYNSQIIEAPTKAQPSTVVQNNNDEIKENMSLQIQSKICEISSSENPLKTESGPKSVESKNQDVSCDKKLEHCKEDSIDSSTEKTDATLQEIDENKVCSKTDDTEKNSELSEKPFLNQEEQPPSLPATTSENHVPLEAAASLGGESSSIMEASSNENEIIELNVSDISDQPVSVSKDILQLERTSDSSENKDLEKVEKCINPLEKMNKLDTVVWKNESESNDALDSKQKEKLAVLASSNLVPKVKNSKSYQKIEKNLKRIPSETCNSDSGSPFLPENNKVRRKDKSESLISDNLNVKQRSVRQRKKLILPDFEYGLENKAEFSDSSTNENSSFSMCDSEPVKKRGRPRKKTIDDSSLKTSDVEKKVPSAVTPKKKNTVSSKSSKCAKNPNENEEQSEEFSLNTTINELECDPGFNDSYAADVSLNDSKIEEIIQEEDDDPNDDIHSWLKKVDFSEQTSFTSWCEKPQKKKLGRPPKKKKIVEGLKNRPKMSTNKVESTPKIPTVCNGGSSQVIIKKKKGRPLLKEKSMMIQQPYKTETVITNGLKVESGNETSSADISPKKRGRPCKVKFDGLSDSIPVQSCEATVGETSKLVAKKIAVTPVTSPKTHSEVKTVASTKSSLSNSPKIENVMKAEDAPSEILLVKKRGRPRKSISSSGEDVESSKSLNVGLESNVHGDTSVIENNIENQSALQDASNCSLDHSSSFNIETDLPKTDQSDLSSVGVTQKKRGRPLKKRKLMSKQKEMDTFHKPPQSSGLTNKNEDTTSEMDVLSDVKQENLIDKSNQEQNCPKPTLWKKKISAQRVPVATEKQGPDETIKIDEALYLADLRNKSKYSRVFKKSVITIDEDTADNLVVCGRCHKKMTRRHYLKYHKISHYYLCWLEDEPEINLNDDVEISRILQSWVNPDALRKKAIRLSCELCDKVMKSVVGYVSHVRFCQKKDEIELLEKCTLCPRALKPSSIRHHYIKFHGVTKFATTNDSKLVPVACLENKKDSLVRGNEEIISVTVKNVQMGFERTPVQKVDILNDEHFWKSLKTSYDLYMCMGLNCRHMTLGKDDLKSHILSCSASFCEFTCSSCSYTTKYESEIIYHAKKKCKETSDSEDNAEEKPTPVPVVAVVPDRRISTRVRKRKFVFDYDDFIDVDHSKKSKDDDYISADDDSNDSEGELRDRSRRKRADVLLNKSAEDSGLRNAFLYHYTTRVFDPLGWTVEARLETFATSPALMNLQVDINEWETFPISDFLKYSPIQHKSPKVSFDGSPLVQLKVFDSDLIKGVPVCYTGGPVWSMAWAPLPAHVTEQYLAVAGLQHMNHIVNLDTSVEFASIVQIWKYGSLDNISNDIHAPTLAWAIAHNYGAVWGMEWCPSGGFDNSSTPCRLGIIALATSSGCCVIYSMPRLDCGGETRSIVANPEPDLVLKVRVDDVQCTRIVWKRNSVPDTIYGGFSDGSIALWNVTSTSSILKKGKTLYPYRTFEAHHSGITALDVHWLDNCRFMVSSSSDRTVKFWDLDDLSGPMYEHELTNIALSAAWMHHWVVTAFGLDFVNSTEPTSFVCHPREFTDKRKSILNIKDTFWSVAYSDWNDAVAASSNNGCVVVYAAKHMSSLTYKQPDFEKIVTQTLMVPLSEEEKIQSESVEANTGLPPTNDSYDCSSLVQNYGIKFCDRSKDKPSSDAQNFSINKGNFKSVNKVCWNQNYNSFNWLALGYDCGFVRVIRVERFDKTHLTKFYKLNENSTITLV